MRLFFGLFLALFIATHPAGAGSKVSPAAKPKFQSAEDVLKWMNGYRQKPEVDQLPDAVRAMFAAGTFKDLESAGVYVGFIGGVIGSNPEKSDELVAKLFPMPPEDQVVVIKAIAYSGHPEWKTLLKSFVERMPARKVLIERYLYDKMPDIDHLTLDSGAFALDVNWGFYFATGSNAPIGRIVSSLAWTKEKNNLERLTIGSMAKWTLAQNAARDMDLLQLLKADLSVRTGDVRPPLSEVVEAAETYELGKIRKDALASIEELKTKGPEANRNFAWWGQAGQTALALGCVAASVTGHIEFGIPCVVGGAASTAALKYLAPAQ